MSKLFKFENNCCKEVCAKCEFIDDALEKALESDSEEDLREILLNVYDVAQKDGYGTALLHDIETKQEIYDRLFE